MTDFPVRAQVWNPVPEGGYWCAGEVEAWSASGIEPRFNQVGPWSMSLPFTTETAAAIAKDSVLTFDFRGDRMTGLIEQPEPYDEGEGPMLDLSGVDALAWLGDAQCFPDPDSPISVQNVVAYIDQGPTETICRTLVRKNLIERLGYDLVLAADQGRGQVTRLKLGPLDNMLPVILRKCKRAGLGVRVGLEDTSDLRAQMVLRFYQPVDRSGYVRVSPATDTLQKWRVTNRVPTATRVYVLASEEESAIKVESVSVAGNSLTMTGNDDKPRAGTEKDIASLTKTNGSRMVTAGAQGTFKAETDIGRSISGSGIPAGTTISKVVDGNTAQLSKDATATNTAAANLGPEIIKHHLRTGSVIRFSGKGEPPAPLLDHRAYFAIRVDADTFQVARTRSLAMAGQAINLTDHGTDPFKITETSQIRRRVADEGPAEGQWNRRREVSIKVGIEDDDEKDDPYIEAGQEALADAAEESGTNLTIHESEGLAYGEGYPDGSRFGLGDSFTIELLPADPTISRDAVSIIDRLGAVRMEVSSDQGMTLELIPGNPDANKSATFRLGQALRVLRGRVANVETEEP